jgi:hypothetical protein
VANIYIFIWIRSRVPLEECLDTIRSSIGGVSGYNPEFNWRSVWIRSRVPLEECQGTIQSSIWGVAGLGDADPFSGFGFLTQKITEEKDQENNVWSYFPLEFLGLTYFKHTAMETLPDFKPPPHRLRANLLRM